VSEEKSINPDETMLGPSCQTAIDWWDRGPLLLVRLSAVIVISSGLMLFSFDTPYRKGNIEALR